jgi:glyoxylase-like metal-dependent hydrolase (beta-lactamase superfamily II)
MPEEVLANLYKLEIPLPDNPLRALNSYVIKGSERNLIIDTGWDREECMNAMQAGLRKLKVDLRKTDFFITHLHADHLGLVSNIATDTSTIYFNQPDADLLKDAASWEKFINFASVSGFPEDELQSALHNHPGFKYGSKGHLAFAILREDDTISIGEYRFKCVETPGHTKGHMCLYEPDMKVLVAGDHVLNDITPNIQLWSDDMNPLKEYLASLDKVYEYHIELVLPGHRGIFRNCKERIQELKHHHEKRAEEVLSILEKGSKNAFQVASQMSWDITYDSWDLFPFWQKLFATGEAIAHLKYLEEREMIRKETQGQKMVFSLRSDSRSL